MKILFAIISEKPKRTPETIEDIKNTNMVLEARYDLAIAGIFAQKLQYFLTQLGLTPSVRLQKKR